jgi:hypothetical protein
MTLEERAAEGLVCADSRRFIGWMIAPAVSTRRASVLLVLWDSVGYNEEGKCFDESAPDGRPVVRTPTFNRQESPG